MAAWSVTVAGGQARIDGSVSDKGGNPVSGARIALESVGGGSGQRAEAQSDQRGAFRIELAQAGTFHLTVTHDDFFAVEANPIELAEGTNAVRVELVQSRDAGTVVDVRSEPRRPADQIAMSTALVEEEIDSMPVTRATKQRIQGVAAVLPGVVRTAYGDIHLHGSRASETNWSLDGFNLSDPATGELEMALGAESVRSVEVQPSRYSAAVGRGAGGALALESRVGGDNLRQRFTNFVPGVELNRGLRFRDWRPRHNLSGPLIPGRAWFFNSFDALYEENFFRELPRGQDRNRYWSINNSLRARADLTPRHTLSSGLVADYLNAPNSGLTPLSPMETTLDQRARRHFFNVKHQVALSGTGVLDIGYAAYRSSYRAVPQGTGAYRITALGRAGNYPVDMLLLSGRDEIRADLLASWGGLGRHEWRAGVGLSRTQYSQGVRRSPIEYYALDGTLLSRLEFAGSGRFTQSNLETGTYVQDRWRIGPRLIAEIGLRWDRDRTVARGAVTPRFSLALTPPGMGRSRLSAGLGWIPAATYLRILTRHRDQHSVYRAFAPDGKTPPEPPQIRLFELDPGILAIPRARNFSASWNQGLPGATDIGISYLRKRLSDGYAQVPASTRAVRDARLPLGGQAVRFQLQNTRRDAYDSVEFSLSRPLLGSERWFLSYTYSKSWSNAPLEVETGAPIRFSQVEGRLAWDVPHRLVSWAMFPLGKQMSVAYLCEWKDGFPFSAHDARGELVGQVHSWRLPRQFSLNVHVQREVSFLGHRWSLRPGVDNLTNRPNYRFVNNNADSPQFLELSGRTPIKLVVRLRWLGKASK